MSAMPPLLKSILILISQTVHNNAKIINSILTNTALCYNCVVLGKWTGNRRRFVVTRDGEVKRCALRPRKADLF